MDKLYAQFQQRYQQLCAMRDAGQLNPQQFFFELQRLRWQDSRQRWWTIDPDGVLLYFNGQQWVPAQPPQPARAVPAQAPAPPSLPVQPSPPPQAAAPRRSPLRSAAPILALIPSLLCGTVWFLYTFIGVFKGEGLGGVDFITPLIIGGLPVLFLALRKPLDKLLHPLKPVIQAVPKLLRWVIALAVPIALSLVFSILSPGGYWGLNVASFVSVMTAAVLLRF